MPDTIVRDNLGNARTLKEVHVRDNLGNARDLKEIYVRDNLGNMRLVFQKIPPLTLTWTAAPWSLQKFTGVAPPYSITVHVDTDGTAYSTNAQFEQNEDWNSLAPTTVPADLTGWTVTATHSGQLTPSGDALGTPLDFITNRSFVFTSNSEGELVSTVTVTIDDGQGTSETKTITITIENGTP